MPLACDRQRSIEVHAALAEGASVAGASALVAEVAAPHTTVVLCTHGDVVWNLLVGLAHHSEDLPMAKGSTWVVEVTEGRLTPVRYLSPP